MNNSKTIINDTVIFGTGAYAYGMIEVLWRGSTHPTMLFAGGLCFLSISKIAASKLNFTSKCLAGGAAVTAVEFIFGCVFNLGLGLKVWDYSNQPLNILGQICPLFFIMWCGLTALGIPLSNFMLKQLKRSKAPA